MNSSDQIIEQILVLRCQIGDKEALAELIDRYQGPLRYFINRLSANPEMAEDILLDGSIEAEEKSDMSIFFLLSFLGSI